MKRLSIFHVLGLAFLAITFNACVEDPAPGPGGLLTTPPELSFVETAGFVSDDATVTANSDFNVRISATAGDSPLNVFYLQEDGLEVPSERFLVDGQLSGGNPKLILGDEKQSLTWDLTIRAHETGTSNYRFIVEDDDGETSSLSINISTDGGTPPVVEIGGSGTIPDVPPGGLFQIPLTVGAGTFPLSSITVLENGVPIADFANRLFYDDIGNPFTTNPYLLPAEDVNGFMRTIFIRAGEEAGTNTYTVQLADDAGNITENSFDVVTGIAGTPTTLLQGVLFNAAGPAGTGGLDLDTGNGTGSSDALSEIRDQGIDIGQSNDVNWIKKIAAINGSSMVFLSPGNGGLSETFTFASVEVKEQIAEVFTSGVTLNTDADGNPESFFMEVGDMYALERDGTYYLFVVREINETPDNNDDNYVIDIQF